MKLLIYTFNSSYEYPREYLVFPGQPPFLPLPPDKAKREKPLEPVTIAAGEDLILSAVL